MGLRQRLRCRKKQQEKENESDHDDIEVEEEPPIIDKIEYEALREEYFHVDRPLYNYPKFVKEYPSRRVRGYSFKQLTKDLHAKHCAPSAKCVKKNIFNRIPCLKWLKKYNIKDDLLADFFAGLTVGIMHVPQGLAYALLAGVPPVYGLYTSFFPAVIYWIFGTSYHASIGTDAVTCLFINSAILGLEGTLIPPKDYNSNQTDIDSSKFISDDPEKARIMVASAHAFWVGIIQMIMWFFQLGFITAYLAEPFVNSFIAGCSIHVFTSQIKSLVGLKFKSHTGMLKIPKIWIDIFRNIMKVDVPTLVVSIVSLLILGIVKFCINEPYEKKLPIPIPIELVVVS
jgi:MFS superfamily sulfate permease-like transporter